MDSCVVALWKHQMTVLCSVVTSHRTTTSRSKYSALAPEFLSTLLSDLSRFMTLKVLKQCNGYLRIQKNVVLSLDTSYEHAKASNLRSSPIATKTTHVDAAKSQCTCPGYRSIRLPCKHLFYVARDLLKMRKFPLKGSSGVENEQGMGSNGRRWRNS